MPKLDTLYFTTSNARGPTRVYCYDNPVRSRESELGLPAVRALADDAAALGCRRVVLSEVPTFRRDWREVALAFDRHHMEVSFTADSTLMDDEVMAFLELLSLPTLSILLARGAGERRHLEGWGRLFENARARLARFRDAGVDLRVTAVVGWDNLAELPTLVKIAENFNCPVRLMLLHDHGRTRGLDGRVLGRAEVLRLREYCHLLNKGGIDVSLNLPPLLQHLGDVIPACGAAGGWAQSFCGVLANGDVTLCGATNQEPQLVAGNLNRERFAEIWQYSRLFARARRPDPRRLRGACGRCPFHGHCGGAFRLSAYRGAGDHLPPYHLCRELYDAGYIAEELLLPISAGRPT